MSSFSAPATMKVYAGAPYGDISGVQACRYSENISSHVISCMMFPDDLIMCTAVCVCAGGGVLISRETTFAREEGLFY
jgi:hypothetical protein